MIGVHSYNIVQHSFVALKVLSAPPIHAPTPNALCCYLANPVAGRCFKPQDKYGSLPGAFILIKDLGGGNKEIKLVIRMFF